MIRGTGRRKLVYDFAITLVLVTNAAVGLIRHIYPIVFSVVLLVRNTSLFMSTRQAGVYHSYAFVSTKSAVGNVVLQ